MEVTQRQTAAHFVERQHLLRTQTLFTLQLFDKIGVYLGADVNVDRWDWGHDLDDTKFSFGLEAGYAFFLTRTVTIEPAAYWNVNSDRSKFGLKVGFGFYF